MNLSLQFLDKIPLRYRLTVAHSAVMVITYFCFGIGLFKVVEKNLSDSLDSALSSTAQFINDSRVLSQDYSMDLLVKEIFETHGIALDLTPVRAYAQIMNVSGKIRSKTANIRVDLPITPKSYYRAERGFSTYETFTLLSQTPLRQFTLPVMVHGKFTGEIIQVASPLDQMMHSLGKLTLLLWISLPLAFLISVLIGYILTVRALKPVQVMSKAVSQMSINDLGTRLPVSLANDEISDLSTTFNRLLARLEDAFSRLRRFSGNVSHELRTPLTVLKGEAELALRKKRPLEEYEMALARIVDEANQMTKIVEDLLLLARAQSKAVAISWEKIDLAGFLSDIVGFCQELFLGRNIPIQITVDPLLWQIEASRSYLTLILKNLLINAIKHSKEPLPVEIFVYRVKKTVFFAIKDKGSGIDEAHLPYIFDPFFRADTARNRSLGGVGLGLSLSLALAELHFGTIDVESKLGEGSTFTVSIPQNSMNE